MATPRITPEENERIARRERITTRIIVAVIVLVIVALLLIPFGGMSQPDVGPDPSEQACMTWPTPECP